MAPLVSAIFEIADRIDRDGDRDRGVYGMANNHLRIHWLIRRLTFKRRTLDERTEIFMPACRRAEVGWLVDFASSAITDHHPRKGKEPTPSDRCLVNESALPELRSLSLAALRSAAAGGTLIKHTHLLSMLFRWRELAEDGGKEARTWTSGLMDDDQSLVMLARACTGESWSHTMGFLKGLGDRVSTKHVQAQINGLDDILDPAVFRNRLNAIAAEKRLDPDSVRDIEVFLSAWERHDKGDDD